MDFAPYRQIKSRATRSQDYVWGFYVYRVDYNDQSAWEVFLEDLKEVTLELLKFYGLVEELGRCLRFTPVEDRVELEGASVEEVGALFRKMVDDLVRYVS